jgi:hypothetical protein
MRSAKNDTSPPLRSLPPAPAIDQKQEVENENPDPVGFGPDVPGKDDVVQRFFGPMAMPTPIVNFAGINSVGSGCNCSPPDPVGDVGPNHVVEMVNNSFQIWDKTGTSLLGPVHINTLFTGFGAPCETTNNGDPIVIYDQLSDRWLLSQFVSGAPYGMCIAVSSTADPTGSYNRYYFPHAHPNQFYDYPKFGMWPDAFYMTANRFTPALSFIGPATVAYDRAAMIAGTPATLQEIDPPDYFSTLLPADLDGSTLPPAGAPNYMATTNGNRNLMRLWRFHVDWATPANSTLTGPTNIPVALFDPNMCGGSRNCIPQPSVAQKVDALAGRLMNRLAYRNMGDHEVLVGTSTVDENGADHAGVRWYEVRDPNGSPFIYQQGTYAPDAEHRWLPSIAMDHDGNIAVGYSVSSSTTFPSLRYSGRLATDPLGTLQDETTLIAGTGSQTAPNRWGDYASMSIDPVDDCTFWFTSEYQASTGSYVWSTRIGSFKFPGCGQTTPTPTRTGTPPTSTPTSIATSTPTAVPSVCANYVVATGTATLTGGTNLIPNSACDDCTVLIDLPFGVKLYGDTFTSAFISSNGSVEFGSSDSAYGNACLPAIVYDHTIIAYWDDLNTAGTGLGIYTATTGAEPNRDFHIEWRAQTFSGSGNPPVNFEVVLHEGSNNFEMVYAAVYNGGADTTIGVQRDERYFTEFSCNTSSVAAGTQLSFTIGDCPIPTSTPTTGITATVPPGSTPTVCPITFTDVPVGSTFYEFIRCLACRGIINGYPDGTFKPNNNVTRGQLSKIVSNSAGFNDPQTAQMFEDVPVGSTFFDFVGRLAGRGYISGYPCGGPGEPCNPPGNLPYFRPNANATRGQISKIVSNAAGFQDPVSGQTFQDVPPGSTFYDFIERLASRGVMGGYPCGGASEPCVPPTNRPYFRPNNNATRGQTSKIVSNAFFPACATPARR